jgi:hypothetical protein
MKTEAKLPKQHLQGNTLPLPSVILRHDYPQCTALRPVLFFTV